MGVFLKWWYRTQQTHVGFTTKKDQHLGCEIGGVWVPPFKETPRLGRSPLLHPAKADLMETLHHSLMAKADQRCTALLESLEVEKNHGLFWGPLKKGLAFLGRGKSS